MVIQQWSVRFVPNLLTVYNCISKSLSVLKWEDALTVTFVRQQEELPVVTSVVVFPVLMNGASHKEHKELGCWRKPFIPSSTHDIYTT